MQQVSTVALAWGQEHCPFPVLDLVARLHFSGLTGSCHQCPTQALLCFPAALPALCHTLPFPPRVQVPTGLV